MKMKIEMKMERASLFRQWKILVWKNYLLKKRNKKYTLQEILTPLYMLLLMVSVNALVQSRSSPELHSFPEYNIANKSLHRPLSGHILVVPDNVRVRDIMNTTVNILEAQFDAENIELKFFSTEEKAANFYQSGEENVFAGIIFKFGRNQSFGDFHYVIRFPFTDIDVANFLYRDQSQCRTLDGSNNKDKCDANIYLHTGFAALQTAVDSALVGQIMKKTPIFPRVKVKMMPKPSFQPDTKATQIRSAVFFVLAYSPLLNVLVITLVAEKEKKLKEIMTMMGLREVALWSSWAAVYAVLIAIVTLLVTFIAWVAQIFVNSNMLILFLMLYMYGLSIITASFTITTFLNKTVIAGAVTNILTILIGILYFAVAFTQTPTATGLSYSIPFSARCLLCLLSPFSLAIAIDQTVFLDLGGSGLTFSTLTSGEFPVLVPLAFLILDTGLYFLLALVFDRILPKDNGTGQPPCFMFRSSSLHTSVRKALREIVDMARETEEDTGVDEEMVEPVSNEIRQKLGISINNMTTVFGKGKEKVMAVNGLSLDIYEDQVTAILGHNGAGKTTTLNILTGLSKATSGTAHILGLDVSQPSNMVKIRSMMGVCPQENILFDDLTCAEHLTLFAAIKGVKQIEQELLFLDEPTAGVDTDSRRHIWSVLKGLKKGRIIVLNTHVMEEADILADRKAIITKGTLKCCGSSVFLKNRFGIGYHLNVVLRADTTHEDVHSYVSKFIPGLKIGKVHKKEVDFVLPLTQVSKFPALFAGLEEEMAMPVWKSLGVINYGISMTTLEEVFLQIGKEGENSKLKDLKNKHPVPYKDDEQLLSSSQLEVEDEDNYNETDFSKLHCGKLLSGKQLKWEQFKAVLWMRILNDKRNKGQLLLQGEHPNEFALKAFYYTTMKGFMPYEGSAIHAIPVLINLMSNCLLKRLAHLSGISHHDYSVSISSMLWPSSLSPYSITSIIGLNTFALAFVFLQTRMGLDIVKDRQRKHQYTLLDDDDDITVDIDIEDEDVRMERRRVQAFKFETQVPACMVCGVRKEYPKPGARRCCCCWGKGKVHVAVDNSSFAVRRGEVFGLLGPNGAGKSTTLSLITDDVKPNRGQISICGLNNHSSQFTSLHPMGFCPQVDALWASLTLKEHLECYAQIRGLSREKRRVVINFLLKYLNLKEDADKLTPVLSGGTKRKLSYCMSILGNPCAVLLDEPSTGIDPHAKQLLWKMILGSVKSLDCGVLLTTHNMEEADALCSRIAIMVNGKLECLGSGQHLKNKFGSNYILDVKSKTAIEEKPNREVMDRIKAYVSKHFPGAEIREEFDDRAQFKIPRTSIASLARAFSLLEEAKTSDLVEEYSFTQPTLEQVFLEFTRNQQIDDLTKQ
ncbi:ABCA5-like protein [Mya arenaria]|uniref:ABCA5-like protein n=1 Tax=Mya arenaria TaxID=6604 RepID=A0ABY7DP67_MYAAR|nr:ABCA5-like protein [Mya arenaria]